MKKNYALVALAGLALASCADKEGEVVVRSYYEQLVGDIDKNQTWKNSHVGTIAISTPYAGVVSIYCEDDANRVYLSAIKVSAGEKTLTVDIPQHLEAPIEIFGSDENENPVSMGTVERDAIVEYTHESITETKRVKISQLKRGNASVVFGTSEVSPRKAADTDTKAVNETPNKSALTGPTNGAKIYGYSTFPGDILTDFAKAQAEGVEAKGQVNNFELISNGKFLISMFYGVTGNSDREVGYYYFDDAGNMIRIPFCNALLHDFYYDGEDYTKDNPISKTQIRKNGQWYDVNYDHYDRISKYTNTAKQLAKVHQNDKSYVIEDEFKFNKADIEEVRGVTFIVDVPKGKKFGFYCGGKDSKYEGGKKIFYNHTETSYNKAYGNVTKFTAIVRVYNGYRFIGLEDTFKPSANQADCNDIGFVMVPGGNLPDIRLPYVKDLDKKMYYNGDGTHSAEPKADAATDGVAVPSSTALAQIQSNLQTWTIGFEDKGVKGDYDLNDVVIRVTPIPSESKAKVTLCAVGAADNVVLHFNDRSLGEVHYLMGIGSGQMVNTALNQSNVDYVDLGYVDWPVGKTMTENANEFFIENSLHEYYSVPTKAGEVPVAICVPGEWRWPLEKNCVSDAYLLFGKWGANYQKSEYYNWYTTPTLDKVF